MSNDEHKQKVTATFDMASEGYDGPGLHFFVKSASHLIKKMQLKGNEHLLDIATGTGHVAVVAAQALENGRVTGIDLSEKMLQKAISKADGMHLRNAAFKRCDIEHMGFEDNTFDAACCTFGLFFLPNIENGLRCISKVLKPGGKLGITSFAPSLMMPLRGMFVEKIKKYGAEEPKLSWMRMDSPDKITLLMSGANFADIQIESKQMGYYLKSSREWGDILWNSGHRGVLNQLSGEKLKSFMNEHLHEVDGIADENGIWLDVEVLFATATVRKESYLL